uniref:RING-type E3 ubiquitin transferase n=1 Tax=Timema genevievae TaxID=629358 RepID=A0A7R9K630_TIMGE|nr:unnamed protein product [Timema genevievae]
MKLDKESENHNKFKKPIMSVSQTATNVSRPKCVSERESGRIRVRWPGRPPRLLLAIAVCSRERLSHPGRPTRTLVHYLCWIETSLVPRILIQIRSEYDQCCNEGATCRFKQLDGRVDWKSSTWLANAMLRYHQFLDSVLPRLLLVRWRMWSQCDGAPTHYGAQVQQLLSRRAGGMATKVTGPHNTRPVPVVDTKMATLGVSTLLRNEFSRRLSQLLECPSCHNYMVEDIYQCVNGDSICSSCKKTMAKCPTCSGDFVDTRCVFAEKIAQEIYYPCKNAQTGCQDMLLMKDRTYHELNCLYRLYSCIKGNKCEWQGTLTNLIKHIEELHKFDSTEDITAKFWNYTTTVDSVHELSVFTQGELFLCVRVYKSDSNKHLFYVTHVGIKENSAKFRYDLSLYTPDANKQTISLTNITIPNIAEDIDIYESGQGVVLDDFMVKRLVVGDKLRYKFAIRSNEKQA